MGFRPSFSTESALIKTTYSWFSLLDSNFSTCAVFFDLCKAFDSIPHRSLLDTLPSYNIPPQWLSLRKSLLLRILGCYPEPPTLLVSSYWLYLLQTRKLLSFIFRNFYFHSSPSTLLKLYQSFILPHFCYRLSLWDPRQLKDIKKLERRSVLCTLVMYKTMVLWLPFFIRSTLPSQTLLQKENFQTSPSL